MGTRHGGCYGQVSSLMESVFFFYQRMTRPSPLFSPRASHERAACKGGFIVAMLSECYSLLYCGDFIVIVLLCCGCCRNRLALFFFQTFLRRFLQRTLSSRFRSSQKGIRFREYQGWKESQRRRVDKCKTSRRPSCWDKSPTPTRSLFRFFVFFVACISARKASAHLQCTNGRAG